MPKGKKTDEGSNEFITEGAYTIIITGESEAPFRGGTPKDIDKLLLNPPKSIEALYLKVAEAAVDKALQAGDVEGAAEIVEKHEKKLSEQTGIYGCPLNVFKRDVQAGDIPYVGAHAVFGAFRDSSKFVHKEEKYFYQKGRKGFTTLPSPKHLRKFVTVRPNHIFFHRPSMNGNENIIKVPDIAAEGQQPIDQVKGFAKYEVINPPFQFQFRICISPKGIFTGFLNNRDHVREVVYQMPNHGLGSGRSANHGVWRIIKLEERSGILYNG